MFSGSDAPLRGHGGRLRLPGAALALLLVVSMAAVALLSQGETARAVGTEVKVTTHSQFGDILTDAAGRTLYLFKNDRRMESNCSGGCLTAWPPLLTDEPPVAGDGVNQGRLGTIERDDGSLHVVYNGFPLYYWQNDAAAGDTLGQDRGGVWFVVNPYGSSVHTSAKIQLGSDATFGDIITDESGRVLYLWKRDEKDKSNCNGGCALAWPPLLTTDAPSLSGGLADDRLGTITRDDGSTQVTYNGLPLYYFFRDTGPGDTAGQEVGRTWYVVSTHGAAIHTVAPLNLAESSEFGTILADRSGRILYLFDPDDPGVSNCNGGCALNWPPFLTSRSPIDIGGVDTGLLGTTVRADGHTQVTYNGFPLYYFFNDVGPGDTNGQTVGGVWWVLDANGNKIDAPTSSTTAERAVTAGSGGAVRSHDGRVAVTVPGGAVSEDGSVRLAPVNTPSSDIGLNSVRVASGVVEMAVLDGSGGVVSGRLGSPAQVCVTYSGADADGSTRGALGLRVLQFNSGGGGYWVTLNTQVDLLRGQVCAQTAAQGALALGQSTR